MPVVAFALPSALHGILMVAALVLGFGFVIFWHELGHFLAAKWVGIKVEQFAVGFGQALLSWRKGVGLRVGNTQKEYNQRIEQYIKEKYKNDPPAQDTTTLAYQQASIEAEKALGLGETEYRLNWIPLGGYVKMLGQDDLRPNAQADDPRSYNRKPVPARMLVVSAGVIMNVILAGIGFMVLFMVGFNVPPAWVGGVTSDSPAVNAFRKVNGKQIRTPLQAGDKILEYQGKPQDDFTKIGLNVALSPEGVPQPIKVEHADGSTETLFVTPQSDPNNGGFLSMGIHPAFLLQGPDPKDVDDAADQNWRELQLPEARAIQPGDIVTQIDGKDVDPTEFWKLEEAFQNPQGRPIDLTVKNQAHGSVRHVSVQPHFGNLFGGGELNFAGLTPRTMIPGIQPESAARGKILPGDIVLSITVGGDSVPHSPSAEEFRQLLREAGKDGKTIDLMVLRDGKQVAIKGLSASTKIETGKGQKSRGLGVGLGYDELHPVVTEAQKDSPAYNAAIPAGATLTAIGDEKVANWFDVQRLLSQAEPGVPVVVHFTTAGGAGQKEMVLNEDQIAQVKGVRRGVDLLFKERIITRKARSPIQAAYWGITETRDFILQFYLTLRRMAGGSVSPDQLMGPVGIFVGGARFAVKGWDWLLWFLSMISANLAVVNFLPIPIVDGGLFTFLILEKLQGRPLSARTQAIAQYVGLAFLAGVFLFVTYHDILRFI